MIMRDLVKLLINIFIFFLISTTCLHAGLNGKIININDNQIEIAMDRDETSFKTGEKIEVSYMAGMLEMHIGVFELEKTWQNIVYANVISVDIPPSKGMNVIVSGLNKVVMKDPDPGAMLPPSEDPRSIPENMGGDTGEMSPAFNADMVEGEVVEVMGTDVRIKLTSSGVVRIGYVANLVYQTSSGSQLPVGSWSVTRINGGEVFASALDEIMKPRVGIKANIMPSEKKKTDESEIVTMPIKKTKKEDNPISKADKGESDLEKRARQGDPKAQNRLGMNYQKGRGVEQNYEKAYFWYKKAADQNDADGQNNVGWFYEKGFGVNKDLNQATRWYKKAAHQGYATAQNNLGRSYQKGHGVQQDYQKAVYWYKKAAESGHRIGQKNMGWMCQQGLGVEKDLARAASWYKKAADQGYATAQNNLGGMYNNGYGVKKDIKQALHWYLKAANQGNARAQNNLGVLYIKGDGIPRDREKAISWWKKAAKNGNITAKNNLKKIGKR